MDFFSKSKKVFCFYGKKKSEITTAALTQKVPCISKSFLILACELTEERTVIYYSLYNEQRNRVLPCPSVGVTIRQILRAILIITSESAALSCHFKVPGSEPSEE